MTLKVIQWATGPVGRSALRHLIINPAYELVGVYVNSADKVGMDAGKLVGLSDTGIKTTNDKAAIRAMQADAVVFAPRMPMTKEDLDSEVFPLLESGKNVVTPSGYWFPPLHGNDYVQRVEAACRKGNASVFGAGENPGFFLAHMAPMAATGCSELRSISAGEFVDCSQHPSPTMVFDVLCFGKDPKEAEAHSPTATMLDRCTKEDLSALAHHLGIEIEGFEKESRFATLDHDIECAVGRIAAGTLVAQSHRWSALKNGKPVLTFQPTWFVTDKVPGWSDLYDHWNVVIDGRPCMHIDFRCTTSFDRLPLLKWADTDSGAMDTITAMTCVNAIPAVCAAPPGIVYPNFFGGTPLLNFA